MGMSIFELVISIISVTIIPYIATKIGGWATSERKRADTERIALIAETIVAYVVAHAPPGKKYFELAQVAIAQLRAQFPWLKDEQLTRAIAGALAKNGYKPE